MRCDVRGRNPWVEELEFMIKIGEHCFWREEL